PAGESYISELFGQREYKSYLLLDFSNIPAIVKDLFLNESHDLDSFFMKLSTYYSVKFHK
ncbi:MAG: hypothetical protein WC102_10050, partial [Saccharofermentanales bacterium]